MTQTTVKHAIPECSPPCLSNIYFCCLKAFRYNLPIENIPFDRIKLKTCVGNTCVCRSSPIQNLEMRSRDRSLERILYTGLSDFLDLHWTSLTAVEGNSLVRRRQGGLAINNSSTAAVAVGYRDFMIFLLAMDYLALQNKSMQRHAVRLAP